MPVGVRVHNMAGVFYHQNQQNEASHTAEHHPLDWPCYLRQSLVFDPVPTALTLLLVSAHYFACCGDSSSGQGVGYRSVLGFVFQTVATVAGRGASTNHTTAASGFGPWDATRCVLYPCICTKVFEHSGLLFDHFPGTGYARHCTGPRPQAHINHSNR